MNNDYRVTVAQWGARRLAAETALVARVVFTRAVARIREMFDEVGRIVAEVWDEYIRPLFAQFAEVTDRARARPEVTGQWSWAPPVGSRRRPPPPRILPL